MHPIDKLPFFIGINEVESWLSRIIDKRVKATWSGFLRLVQKQYDIIILFFYSLFL